MRTAARGTCASLSGPFADERRVVCLMKEKIEASTPFTSMITRARRSGHCPPTTTADYLLLCLAMFDLAPIEDADLSRVDSLSCRWRAVVIAKAVHSSGSPSSVGFPIPNQTVLTFILFRATRRPPLTEKRGKGRCCDWKGLSLPAARRLPLGGYR